MISQPVIDLFQLSDLDKSRMEKLKPKQLHDVIAILADRKGIDLKAFLIDTILRISKEPDKEEE